MRRANSGKRYLIYLFPRHEKFLRTHENMSGRIQFLIDIDIRKAVNDRMMEMGFTPRQYDKLWENWRKDNKWIWLYDASREDILEWINTL